MFWVDTKMWNIFFIKWANILRRFALYKWSIQKPISWNEWKFKYELMLSYDVNQIATMKKLSIVSKDIDFSKAMYHSPSVKDINGQLVWKLFTRNTLCGTSPIESRWLILFSTIIPKFWNLHIHPNIIRSLTYDSALH